MCVDSAKKAALYVALKQARWHFVSHVVPVLKQRQALEHAEHMRVGVDEARMLVKANHKGAE